MAEPSYGRKITAQSDKGATQAAWQFGEKGAKEYLNPAQSEAYQAAYTDVNAPMQVGMGFRRQQPEIARREQAFEKMNRLRDIAGTNALGTFESEARKLAKPKKLRAAQGFLTEEFAGPAELPGMTAHPGRMSQVSGPSGETWAQRYENLKGNVVDDTAFRGVGSSEYASDPRVQLAQRFRNMRLGMTPDVATPQPGGWANRNAPRDEFLFDDDVRKMQDEARKRAFASSRRGFVPRFSPGASNQSSSSIYAAEMRRLQDALRNNPEDIYAGTWEPS